MKKEMRVTLDQPGDERSTLKLDPLRFRGHGHAAVGTDRLDVTAPHQDHPAGFRLISDSVPHRVGHDEHRRCADCAVRRNLSRGTGPESYYKEGENGNRTCRNIHHHPLVPSGVVCFTTEGKEDTEVTSTNKVLVLARRASELNVFT